MKKFLAILSALLMMILAIVPMTSASAASSSKTMYVSCSNGKALRMRDEPSTSSSVICSLRVGTKVTVISQNGDGWSYVKAEGHSKKGYVMTKFLSSKDPTATKQTFRTVTRHTITVQSTRTGGYVNLRSAASKHSTSLRQLKTGTKLTVIAESRSWYKVVDGLGNTGYVVKAYTRG